MTIRTRSTFVKFHARLRPKGDERPWEEIDPLTLCLLSHETPADALYAITHDAVSLEEIRWNWPGSMQGHYYRP